MHVAVTNPTRSSKNWIWTIDTGVSPGLWGMGINKDETKKGFCFFSVRTATEHPVYVAYTQDVASDGGALTNDAQEYPMGTCRSYETCN